jgi:hypothetical protein
MEEEYSARDLVFFIAIIRRLKYQRARERSKIPKSQFASMEKWLLGPKFLVEAQRILDKSAHLVTALLPSNLESEELLHAILSVMLETERRKPGRRTSLKSGGLVCQIVRQKRETGRPRVVTQEEDLRWMWRIYGVALGLWANDNCRPAVKEPGEVVKTMKAKKTGGISLLYPYLLKAVRHESMRAFNVKAKTDRALVERVRRNIDTIPDEIAQQFRAS